MTTETIKQRAIGAVIILDKLIENEGYDDVMATLSAVRDSMSAVSDWCKEDYSNEGKVVIGNAHDETSCFKDSEL